MLLFCLLIQVSNVSAKARDSLQIDLPNLEVIPGASWFWVAQKMARNNVPMTIKMFSYPGSEDKVEKFYTGVWKTKGHGKTNLKKVGNLTIMTFEEGQYAFSVQFAPNSSGVEGKLVVTSTPLTVRANKKTSLPVPPRSSVFNKVESLDGGRRSETVNIQSKLRVAQLVDFYRTEFRRENWKLYGVSGDGVTGSVLSFQRGGELLQLTITGLQGLNSKFAEVLIHWIK